MSVGVTREEYEIEREQFHRALDCIEAMARDHAEDRGLDDGLYGDRLLVFVDDNWARFVPRGYRDLVSDE